MVKITSKELIDVVKYTDRKIILAEKALAVEGGYKTGYFILDLETLEKEVVTKNAYLIKKFGNSAFKKIGESIADFTDCEAVILPNRNVFIIFSNGQCAMYDRNGEMLWQKTLTYNDKTVTGLAADGEYVWCCCKEEDCVIRYQEKRTPSRLPALFLRTRKAFTSAVIISSEKSTEATL